MAGEMATAPAPSMQQVGNEERRMGFIQLGLWQLRGIAQGGLVLLARLQLALTGDKRQLAASHTWKRQSGPEMHTCSPGVQW